MKRRHALVCACFGALALTGYAQTAPDLIANSSPLPLRNLLIEVRQVQGNDSQRTDVGARGGTQLDTQGHVSVQGGVVLQQRQTQQSGSATQQVLVLNGRTARIALGTVLPLRVLQTVQRAGQRITTLGTVLLEGGTGFSSTPSWNGADGVELEIAAEQALGSTPLNGSASSTSVVAIPLGEWSTVAQTEQDSSEQRSNLGGTRSTAGQSHTEVQVRVTLR